MQSKLLILIESPNIFHWKSAKYTKWVWSLRQNLGQINPMLWNKETGIVNRLFSLFGWGNDLKIPDWKFMANVYSQKFHVWISCSFLIVSLEASSPSAGVVDRADNSYVAQSFISFFKVEFRECFFPSLLFCLLV